MAAASACGMRTVHLLHALHIFIPLALLLHARSLAGQGLAAALLFFGIFTLLHDAMHGALGLPQRINHWLITLAGLAIGISGHGARVVHLRHHARTLAEDDLEGQGARVSLLRAFLLCFRVYAALPLAGLRLAPPRHRRGIALEWLGVLALALLLLLAPVGRVVLVVTLLIQLTIPVWGAHIPHRPPAVLLRIGAALLWTHSPLIIAFVLHDWHHANPRIPTFAQPAAWQAVRRV
jgi:fatty acid desaturase